MAIKVRQGGAWQSITGIKVYANGAWRTLVAVKVYADGAWRAVGNYAAPPTPPGPPPPSPPPPAGTITVSISPSSASGSGSTSIIATGNVTATPSGGLAPYTYAWTTVSSAHSVTISAATLATTHFSMSGLAVDEDAAATFKCTVTDSLGTSANANVPADFFRTA